MLYSTVDYSNLNNVYIRNHSVNFSQAYQQLYEYFFSSSTAKKMQRADYAIVYFIHWSISIKKVLVQTTTSPNITINNYQLEVIDEFKYLVLSSKSYLQKDIYKRIGKESSTLPRLVYSLEHVRRKTPNHYICLSIQANGE